MNGSGPLYDELHRRFQAATDPQPVHRFLASLPPLLRERGAPHQLIVSGRYDLALERAFDEAAEEVDVVTYVAVGAVPREVLAPAARRGAAADRYSQHVRDRAVARAAHHPAQPSWCGRSASRARVGELRDHRGRLHRLPRAIGRGVVGSRRARGPTRRSHFLFLGYEMVDWNLRLVMQRVWGDRPVAYRSWAVDPATHCARARVLASLRRRRARRRARRVRRAVGRRLEGRRERRVAVRGLARFEDSDDDALYFFGRERDTEIVVANLIASRLTVLYGPSGVGSRRCCSQASPGRCASCPRHRSSSCSRPGATIRALARRGSRRPRGVGPGGLFDVVKRAQAESDMYVVLDQAEEYFTYHGRCGRTRGGPRPARRPGPSRERPRLAPRGHAGAARPSQGPGPSHVRQRAASRSPRPGCGPGRHRPAARALERADGERVRAEEAVVDSVLDGVGADRIGRPRSTR